MFYTRHNYAWRTSNVFCPDGKILLKFLRRVRSIWFQRNRITRLPRVIRFHPFIAALSNRSLHTRAGYNIRSGFAQLHLMFPLRFFNILKNTHRSRNTPRNANVYILTRNYVNFYGKYLLFHFISPHTHTYVAFALGAKRYAGVLWRWRRETLHNLPLDIIRELILISWSTLVVVVFVTGPRGLSSRNISFRDCVRFNNIFVRSSFIL